ncbi:MAG TPA: hypothetical protein VE684_03090 [Crenalkalicoccus sp.]|jgi:hypothetical protein|nr:hypothetical protein [Crenalkalicoccus sp.]
MMILVHDVPGRLRFEAPRAKRDLRAAAMLRRRARSIDGVTSATVNPVTGSLVLRYDGFFTTRAQILASLGAQERPVAASPISMARPERRLALTPRGEAIAEMIADLIAKRLVDHAVKVAVAAIV